MEGMLTTAEAARELRVSPSTISRMVERYQLEPAVKLPGLRGAFLFEPTEIARLKEAS